MTWDTPRWHLPGPQAVPSLPRLQLGGDWNGLGWTAGRRGGGILGWGGGWDLLRDPRKAGGDTGGTLSVTRMHWEALGVTGTYWKTLGMLEGHSG